MCGGAHLSTMNRISCRFRLRLRTDYPSARKVGNLLPACDWYKSPFLQHEHATCIDSTMHLQHEHATCIDRAISYPESTAESTRRFLEHGLLCQEQRVLLLLLDPTTRAHTAAPRSSTHIPAPALHRFARFPSRLTLHRAGATPSLPDGHSAVRTCFLLHTAAVSPARELSELLRDAASVARQWNRIAV